MEVSIPSLKGFARRKIEQGHYGADDEVVADVLRLIRVRNEVVAMKRDRLRNALDRGYEDVAGGRMVQLDGDQAIDSLFTGL
jgi:hypothetical protein